MAGFAIYIGTANNNSYKFLLWYIFLANLPDFDFIPGFILGTPNKFHHGISHSIGFTCLIGIATSFVVTKKTTNQLFLKNALIFGGLYFSHVFLDFFSVDTTPPYGEKLLWPMNNEYYISPFKFFLDIRRSTSSNSEFIVTLFNAHNVLAILVEICVMLPIIGLSYILKKNIYTNES